MPNWHSADIERTYGQRKPLAARVPINPSEVRKSAARRTSPLATPSISPSSGHQRNDSAASSVTDTTDVSTPAVTEGDTATSTDFDTETEQEQDADGEAEETEARNHLHHQAVNERLKALVSGPDASSSTASHGDSAHVSGTQSPAVQRRRGVSQHDLLNRYFRKDLTLFKNFDPLRYVSFQNCIIYRISDGVPSMRIVRQTS